MEHFPTNGHRRQIGNAPFADLLERSPKRLLAGIGVAMNRGLARVTAELTTIPVTRSSGHLALSKGPSSTPTKRRQIAFRLYPIALRKAINFAYQPCKFLPSLRT